MDYIESKNLGYDRDNVIYFVKEGNTASNQKAFITELRNIPGIVNASYMSQNIVGVMSYTYDVNWEGKKSGTQMRFAAAHVDFGLLETLGIQMKEGRSFSESFGSDSSGIVFNQAAINEMGLKNPVGKVIKLWGRNLRIIGVTGDFNFESLHEKVKPFFFIIDPTRTTTVMARVKAGMEKATIEKLKKFYAVFNPGFTFDFNFLDQDYQELYSSEQKVVALSKYFAGMAIIISCLGLFGLAAFAAERRIKEIGIRKVLGASVPKIVYLLSKEIIGWILTANLIAWPTAYFFMNSWLDDFAYRTYMELSFFLIAGGSALFIAFLTMSFHSIKAATANPVESLRYE